ncbi:MAG: hypothetical protein ACYDBB_16810 [Armatimonadota bacterium]
MYDSKPAGRRSPPPTLPNPNAFDYYVQAGNALVDKETFNAIHEHLNDFWDATKCLDEKTAFVEKNAQALKLLREGMKYPYRQPPLSSPESPEPYLESYRQLSWLLVLEAQVKSGKGDRRGALASGLDAWQFGIEIRGGGTIVDGLMSLACTNIARRKLWSLLQDATAGEAQEALTRGMAITAHQLPPTELLTEEKRLFLAYFQEMIDHPDKFQPGPQEELEMSDFLMLGLLLHPDVIRNYQQEYGRRMDSLIRTAGRLYSPGRLRWPKFNDMMAENLFTKYFDMQDKVRIKFIENDAHAALMLTVFALRAYQQQHGAYPKNLSALVPEYLPELPADPFSLYATLQYRREGDRYMLYSVGPDGIDNYGKPIDNPGALANQRYIASIDSKGDIVAGVNGY